MFNGIHAARPGRRLPGAPGRCLLALLLLAALALELRPCVGPCALGGPDPAAQPCLSRLRVCGSADLAPGSLADQSILRSEALLPVPPPPAAGERIPLHAALAEGHPLPVYRPPRTAA